MQSGPLSLSGLQLHDKKANAFYAFTATRVVFSVFT